MLSTTLPVNHSLTDSVGRTTRCDAPEAAMPHGRREDLSGLSNFLLADRLGQVWARNARRLESLDDIRERIAAARRHLGTTISSKRLGESYLRNLLSKQDACLAAVRADRRVAAALVRECEIRSQASQASPLLRRAVGG